jgi:ligand-binding SRPBCC domain-containing protein
MPHEFEISSDLAADPDAVAAHCFSTQGVGRELRPWFRMTFPAGVSRLDDETITLGKPLARSLLLLFGVLPVDWDDVTFVELEPDRRFVERSTMASQRVWEHERVLAPIDGGTRVIDRLRWEGRLPGAAEMFDVVVPRLFAWRHRQLKKIFGALMVRVDSK